MPYQYLKQMECAIQYLGLQVSNWVFTLESRDQGQNQVFGLFEGLIFAPEVECLSAVTSVKNREPWHRSCQSMPSLDSFGPWLADPSWVRPVGMTLVWGWKKDWLLLTVLFFNTLHASEIQLSPEITLAAFNLPRVLKSCRVHTGARAHTLRHAFYPILHVWVMKPFFHFHQQLPIFISLLHSARFQTARKDLSLL